MARKTPTSVPPAQPSVPSTLSSEDMDYIRWLEGRGQRVAVMDPLSDEGLRLQALYVQNFSMHPLDVMRRIMENPFSDPKDRMTAAKSIMEYSLRKPAANLELSAKVASLNIDPSTLSALSTKELDTLEKLLSKIGGTA